MGCVGLVIIGIPLCIIYLLIQWGVDKLYPDQKVNCKDKCLSLPQKTEFATPTVKKNNDPRNRSGMSNALGIMLICIGFGVFVYQWVDSEISRKEWQKLSLAERVRLNYKSTTNKYMIGGNRRNKKQEALIPVAIAMLGVYLLKGNEDKKKK